MNDKVINKTIYMTYKKEVPNFVFSRWKDSNKEYDIEFSLDEDCISFLKQHFNDYIVELFKNQPKGMFKADLWRLCKLYIHGGVYADVDLVPHLDIDTLDRHVTFYSCMSKDTNSIFQAFMVSFSEPKNPLILHFLLSFLLNKPYYNLYNGPTYDMFNCIKYNLDGIDIYPEQKYEIKEIKISIAIGRSDTNTKSIDLHFFPNDIIYTIKLLNKTGYSDDFKFEIENNILNITRLDKNTGWDYCDYSVDICIESNETVYFFRENIGENNNWITSYVTYNNKKILDSRDLNYFQNSGW